MGLILVRCGPQMKPRIFIGSSVEGKHIANAIQSNFAHDAYSTVWDQNIFLPSSYTLESLLKAVVEHDFGILVFSPDDVSRIRGKSTVVPRGNVVFEAALFIGKHGRDRCFIVQPRGRPAFDRPTDLEGANPSDLRRESLPGESPGSSRSRVQRHLAGDQEFAFF